MTRTFVQLNEDVRVRTPGMNIYNSVVPIDWYSVVDLGLEEESHLLGAFPSAKLAEVFRAAYIMKEYTV